MTTEVTAPAPITLIVGQTPNLLTEVTTSADGTLTEVNFAPGQFTEVTSNGFGPPGIPAPQSMSPFFQGGLGVRELLYSIQLVGSVNLDAAHSPWRASRGATNHYVISVCKNATYADELNPTDPEIAAALWATVTYASGGQAGPQIATVAYVGTDPGQGDDGDIIDFWSDTFVDPTLNSPRGTLAGP